jgi:hypothetical protein
MDDLEAKVFGKLPGQHLGLPGHGKDTTLGAERPSLRSGASAAGSGVSPAEPR